LKENANVTSTIRQTGLKPGSAPDKSRSLAAIDEMEKAGLLSRSKSKRHKQEEILNLTEKGRALAEFANTIEGFKIAYDQLRFTVNQQFDIPRKDSTLVENRLRARGISSKRIAAYDDASTDVTFFQLSCIRRFLAAVNSKYLALMFSLKPKNIVKDLLTNIHGDALEYISTILPENIENPLTNDEMTIDNAIMQSEAGDCFGFIRKYVERDHDTSLKKEKDEVVAALYHLSNPLNAFIEDNVKTLDAADPLALYLRQLMDTS
jgi:DNA-binding MarR family transcriptional regulator